ncbi:hypothetical protein OO013_17135 [Mangrovivirga sp. M17]|uniref:Uncharacterized protein n=1 Tax=Mangrovivirga halotolerans TaxID=2993936 RepID=A0ABT3RV16_9BACT|nr:hypothetical protein [Mangrovivirga halotolerans]MCX2745609.1 hypothetical protein [Mangrovivirga halotolerans]
MWKSKSFCYLLNQMVFKSFLYLAVGSADRQLNKRIEAEGNIKMV